MHGRLYILYCISVVQYSEMKAILMGQTLQHSSIDGCTQCYEALTKSLAAAQCMQMSSNPVE